MMIRSLLDIAEVK